MMRLEQKINMYIIKPVKVVKCVSISQKFDYLQFPIREASKTSVFFVARPQDLAPPPLSSGFNIYFFFTFLGLKKLFFLIGPAFSLPAPLFLVSLFCGFPMQV